MSVCVCLCVCVCVCVCLCVCLSVMSAVSGVRGADKGQKTKFGRTYSDRLLFSGQPLRY